MSVLRRKPWLVVVAVVVAVLIVFVAVQVRNESRKWDPERVAVDRCTSQVQASLKAPSTAEFSNIRATRDKETDLWTVTGSVDAQNSFGAPLRKRFECPDFKHSTLWISGVTVR